MLVIHMSTVVQGSIVLRCFSPKLRYSLRCCTAAGYERIIIIIIIERILLKCREKKLQEHCTSVNVTN